MNRKWKENCLRSALIVTVLWYRKDTKIRVAHEISTDGHWKGIVLSYFLFIINMYAQRKIWHRQPQQQQQQKERMKEKKWIENDIKYSYLLGAQDNDNNESYFMYIISFSYWILCIIRVRARLCVCSQEKDRKKERISFLLCFFIFGLGKVFDFKLINMFW